MSGKMMVENGMTAFPVFSSLNVQGFGEKELDNYFDGKEALDRSVFGQKVVDTAYDVINGKGWTNAAIAQAAITLAKVVVKSEERRVGKECRSRWGRSH